MTISVLLLALFSICPDWVSRSEDYPFGTEVRYVPNGQYYRALYDVPGTITPTTFEWWLSIESCTDTTETDTTESDTTTTNPVQADNSSSILLLVKVLGCFAVAWVMGKIALAIERG